MAVKGEKQKTKWEMHYVCLNCTGCFYDDEIGANHCCNSSVEEQKHPVCVDCGVCRSGNYKTHKCPNCSPNLKKTTEEQ